jgi:tetratricopeptide (TPR) repeat protein
MLLGGIGYYFSLPPIPPTFNNKGDSLAINPANKANIENELDSSDLDSIGQASVPARPLTPELIKEIEGLVKHQASDQAQTLLTPAIKQAEKIDDKAALAQLLYLQGRVYSQKAEFSRAISILKQAITIASTANKPRLLLGPQITLAGIYHVTDQNAEAANYAKQCLSLARTVNDPFYEVVSLQTLGISSFLIDHSSKAETIIKESLKLASQVQAYDRVIYGYIYLGVIQTESKKLPQAITYFDQALATLVSVNDNQRRTYLESTINGYYARTQAVAGNTVKATQLYNAAISQAIAAGVQQRLSLSQMRQGLAECYRVQGNFLAANKEVAIATELEKEATEFCETGNTILSFAITRKVAKRCLDN